jgi:RNA recognition motif-containing protein
MGREPEFGSSVEGSEEFWMGTRLYVGNLPFSADETAVRALFEQNGRTVSEVKLITDRDTGRPRGFGFVEMESDQQAQQAISQLDGKELDGRQLKVNEARERTGGGGGGRGRFGY